MRLETLLLLPFWWWFDVSSCVEVVEVVVLVLVGRVEIEVVVPKW
jgi:hypothetical protein